MEAVFKIFKRNNCTLEIVGLEKEKDQYKDGFNFEDFATLDLLVKVDSRENKTLADAGVFEHNEETCPDKVILPFHGDGLYLVMHIILPTVAGLSKFSDLSKYTNIYTYQNYKIYKVLGKTEQEWDLEELDSLDELVELNYTDKVLAFEDDVFVFNLCGLRKCFFDITKKILANLCTNKCSTENVKYRDLVWMALNCIQYCIDVGNFYEAQRILEKITTCNGICQDAVQANNSNSSCGCHG